MCYSGQGKDTQIKFVIDNTGDMDISELDLWITGNSGSKIINLNNFQLNAGAVKESMAPYDLGTYGYIKQIQFIPKVKNGEKLSVCTKSSIKAVNVAVC